MQPEFLKKYSEAEVLLTRDLACEDGIIWLMGEAASVEEVVGEDASMTALFRTGSAAVERQRVENLCSSLTRISSRRRGRALA
jgi:hypothetical protein